MAYSTLELYDWIPYLLYLPRILRGALAHWSLGIEALHDPIVNVLFFLSKMTCSRNVTRTSTLSDTSGYSMDHHNKL